MKDEILSQPSDRNSKVAEEHPELGREGVQRLIEEWLAPAGEPWQ